MVLLLRQLIYGKKESLLSNVTPRNKGYAG